MATGSMAVGNQPDSDNHRLDKISALRLPKIGSMAIGSMAIGNLRNLDYPSRTMAQLKEAILPVLNEE